MHGSMSPETNWFRGHFVTERSQDEAAALFCFLVCVVWLKSVDGLVHYGLLGQRLSRKVIHIGTGPIFILTWPNFSSSSAAPYYAALVPTLITLQFTAIGLGLWHDPMAVASLSRTGNPREILRGPLMYGLVFIICTVFFWRHSPAGLLALLVLCVGDGFAEVIGRRFGRMKLPGSSRKSWAGTTAFFAGSFMFGYIFLQTFDSWNMFNPPLHVAVDISQTVGIVCATGAFVEAFPFEDVDNITVPLATLVVGKWLFGR